MNQVYIDTARMMTRVAPFVFADDTFALKGGTAINLFLRDMPRLSVDLDLVFPDYTLPRDEAMAQIAAGLQKAEERLKTRGFQTRTSLVDASETKLLVRRDGIEVKIEVNFVMRGTLYPVQKASLTEAAKALLQADLAVPLVSMEDVYGGKLVAAMDRQHPRDLFDVMQLLAHEGITPNIRKAFVVYLACHNRPVHEVLFPTLRDITLDYERTFNGMTTEPVPLAALLAAREDLVRQLHQGLDDTERHFLVSIVRNRPEWDLMGFPHLRQLPGIRWKLHNLSQLEKSNPKKFAEQAGILLQRLG
jgi:hypothetical protein